MEYFEAGDLLRAMSTCRTLYQVGIPVLLRDVQLLGPEKTRKRRYALYSRHLLKDPARFSCVMSLACSYSALDKQTRNWYLALPRNFKSLRALTVDMETNTLNSSLSRWILSQKFLRELRLQNVGMQALPVMDLMRRLKDNLEVFEIQMVFLHGLEGSFDPILGLLNSSHSLRSLFIECYDYRNGPVIRLDPHLRYPAVQELRWTSSQSVQTAALVKTFPSLRKLHIMHTSFDDFISMLISGALTNGALLELRRSNYDAQHCRHARWTSLDLLQGGILTLWTLALRCCVIRLETTLRGRNEKVGHLLFVLHDTWPEQLMLSLFPTHVADLDRVLNFPSLQALDLTIPIFRKPDLQGVLKQLVSLRIDMYAIVLIDCAGRSNYSSVLVPLTSRDRHHPDVVHRAQQPSVPPGAASWRGPQMGPAAWKSQPPFALAGSRVWHPSPTATVGGAEGRAVGASTVRLETGRATVRHC